MLINSEITIYVNRGTHTHTPIGIKVGLGVGSSVGFAVGAFDGVRVGSLVGQHFDAQ